jgi:hypothetical protein
LVQDESFIILGQQLLPLKIGHLALLSKYDCEFPDNPGSLATAVLICCQEPREVIPWFKSPTFEDDLKTISQQLGEWEFPTKLEMWRQYYEWNTKLPTIISKSTVTHSQSGVPFHQMLRVILLNKLNFRPSEIDDVLVLQAQWDIAALAQHEGKLTVAGEDIDSAEPLTKEQEEELDSIARAAIEGLSKKATHGS